MMQWNAIHPKSHDQKMYSRFKFLLLGIKSEIYQSGIKPGFEKSVFYMYLCFLMKTHVICHFPRNHFELDLKIQKLDELKLLVFR